MIFLDIENKTNLAIPPQKILSDLISKTIAEKKLIGDFEIGIKIVNQGEMRKLNNKYRTIDAPTDVLSFPIHNKFTQNKQKLTLLGDIVICRQILEENAAKYHLGSDEEFLKLIKHSVLHLLGYHHK
jgi:probable rRNA maturation factor